MKRLSLLTIFSLLFATSAFASFNQQIVEIYPQPDSPLQLLNPVSKWRISKHTNGEEIHMMTVDFAARNVSEKNIRAFTIRHFEGDFKTDVGGTLFSFTLKENGIFQPNQTQAQSMGEFGSKIKPRSIKLAVDFVEFTDGSIWGQNMSESNKRLEGTKQGVKQALEYLQIINKQNGVKAILKGLDNLKDIKPSDEQNEKWKNGFKSGISHIRYGFKQLYDKEGITAVEAELQKQFPLSTIKHK